jgi:hypothetical protein
MDHPKPTSRLVTLSHCEHLRHKGMYVFSAPDPEEFKYYPDVDSTVYWCLKTMKPIGPDEQPVRADRCNESRECCKH